MKKAEFTGPEPGASMCNRAPISAELAGPRAGLGLKNLPHFGQGFNTFLIN